jgi:hypothetical protein
MQVGRSGWVRFVLAIPVIGLVGVGASGSFATGPGGTMSGCAPTLADAMGKDYTDRPKPTCAAASGQSRPLIVDWDSTDRTELEASAHHGLVVVKYEGCEMRVLKRCSVKGGATYDYVGVTPKKDNVVMRDSNEVYANIPVSAVKLEGKLAHAGSLDVNMTIVGQLATSKPVARMDELEGDCEGATHVVTTLTVGSFEFYATNAAEQGASVDVMGAGAGTKQTAQKELLNKDGDESTCAKATGEDTKPPFGCGALLRIEVVPLGQERKSEPTCAPGTAWDGAQCLAVSTTTKCKDGEVADKDKGCVPKKQEAIASTAKAAPPPTSGMVAPVAAACTDAAACDAACQKGDAKGCLGLGGFLRSTLQPGAASADGQRAAAAFAKACDQGEASACTALGEMKFQGLGIAKDAKAAEPLLDKACSLGDYAGCNDMGLVLAGRDAAAAAKYFDKACNDKSQLGCLGLGQLVKSGRGVPKDEKRGGDLIKKACDGKVAAACKLL